MLSFLSDFFDLYELLKAIVIAFIIVLMVRAWAYSVRDRIEKEEEVNREIEDGKKAKNGSEKSIIPISKSIYEENDCSICKKPIWTREGLEVEKGCTVELKCTHRFHWQCLSKNSVATSVSPTTSSNSLEEKDSSYVMVDKVPCCPICLYQPSVIEAKALHKWQTVRFWVLIIDEALDQLATMSGKRGIAWANVRMRARDMSGISLEQLAKGDEQTHGKAEMLAEEDLDGPGQFPYFAALKDGNAVRFQDSVDNVFHKAAGKWMTYHSDRGGERMVFKYSWGIPPFTNCHNCNKFVSDEGSVAQDTVAACAGGGNTGVKSCKLCGHLGAKRLFWCSEDCFTTHEEECKHLLNKMERFRITKNLSKTL